MHSLYKLKELFVFALFLFSFLLITTPQTFSQTAIQFDGSNDYVTFGTASALGTSTFTLEAWIMKTGAGITTSTGTGGVTAIPIITKGRGEAETPANLNCNFFLGLTSAGILTADFEDKATGLNHPVTGTATLSNNVWYHIAATYDGTTWRLFLNGNLETTLVVGSFLPENTSIQRAGLGTAMTSTGVAAGYFAGIIEEPRVWNYARSQVEIQSGMGIEITSGTGLLGRWGLNDGSGTSATNSIGGSPAGTLTNGPTWVTGIAFPALQFDGTNDYVTFGQATSTLGALTFTLECWFKRTGTGSPGTTGSGGITSAIPLITKGRNESDGSVVDMNYWLGIDNTTGTIAADFEDIDPATIDGDAAGQNQPIFGTTVITSNVWHHAAATFDGTFWKLYLDGVLDKTLDVTNGVFPPPRPQYNSTQYAALGSALNSSGVPDGTLGFFAGVIDEARIWNVARTEQQIQDNINLELTSGTGLIGRWALDNGTGTIATNSIGGSPNGTLTNGPFWSFGAPFNLIVSPPSPPTNLQATGINNVLSWNDNSDNETTFQVERSTDGGIGTWSIVGFVAENITTFLDLTANASTVYHYRIFARNSNGDSDPTNVVIVTTPVVLNTSLDFGESSAYVNVNDDASLRLQQFTLETWFRRDGTGIITTTGTNGISNAVPLLAKGCQQAETPNNVNINYFFGIDDDTNVLCGDFEEPTGPNHPIRGTTVIQNDIWYHAAFTFDGAQLKLFLNGNLDATVIPSPVISCASENISALGMGTSIQTTGGTFGYFNGVMDEIRIWNYARAQAEILATINSQLTSDPGGAGNLVARWGLDGPVGIITNGTILTSTVGSFPGTVTGSNASYVYSTSPLPVELASFEGRLIGNKVNLSWRTETEVNNYGFEVLRQAYTSTLLCGTDWEKIGFIPGNGNSNSQKNYSFSDPNTIGFNKFAYRLKQIDNDGKYEYSDIIEVTLLPSEYTLYQNYPNPFNPNTKIRFSVMQDNLVNISLYTILGEKVRTIVNQNYEAGLHEVIFNSSNLPSGVYIYKIEVGENGSTFTSNKKMILLK